MSELYLTLCFAKTGIHCRTLGILRVRHQLRAQNPDCKLTRIFFVHRSKPYSDHHIIGSSIINNYILAGCEAIY